MKITPCNRSGDGRDGRGRRNRKQGGYCCLHVVVSCDVREKETRVILLVRNSEQTRFFATLCVPSCGRGQTCPRQNAQNEPKVGVRLYAQKVISRATSTITAAAGSNGSVPPGLSLSPAGPLPATALIITSYYLGGPIIDSWAVGKRATQLQKLSRRPLFQVRWNFIGARLPRPEMHQAGRTSRDSRWNPLSDSFGSGTIRI